MVESTDPKATISGLSKQLKKMAEYISNDAEADLDIYRETILRYSNNNIFNVTAKYGMREAMRVMSSYLLSDVDTETLDNVNKDISYFSKKAAKSKNEDNKKEICSSFLSKYWDAGVIIPSVVADAMRFGDADIAKDRLKYHVEFSKFINEKTVENAVRELNPENFRNKDVTEELVKGIAEVKGELCKLKPFVSSQEALGLAGFVEMLESGDYRMAQRQFKGFVNNISGKLARKFTGNAVMERLGAVNDKVADLRDKSRNEFAKGSGVYETDEYFEKFEEAVQYIDKKFAKKKCKYVMKECMENEEFDRLLNDANDTIFSYAVFDTAQNKKNSKSVKEKKKFLKNVREFKEKYLSGPDNLKELREHLVPRDEMRSFMMTKRMLDMSKSMTPDGMLDTPEATLKLYTLYTNRNLDAKEDTNISL